MMRKVFRINFSNGIKNNTFSLARQLVRLRRNHASYWMTATSLDLLAHEHLVAEACEVNMGHLSCVLVDEGVVSKAMTKADFVTYHGPDSQSVLVCWTHSITPALRWSGTMTYARCSKLLWSSRVVCIGLTPPAGRSPLD